MLSPSVFYWINLPMQYEYFDYKTVWLRGICSLIDIQYTVVDVVGFAERYLLWLMTFTWNQNDFFFIFSSKINIHIAIQNHFDVA